MQKYNLLNTFHQKQYYEKPSWQIWTGPNLYQVESCCRKNHHKYSTIATAESTSAAVANAAFVAGAVVIVDSTTALTYSLARTPFSPVW